MIGLFKFKLDVTPMDLFRMHPQVVEMTCYLIWHCIEKFGITPSISSLLRPDATHGTGRMIDVSRHEHDFSRFSLTGAPAIVKTIKDTDAHIIAETMNHLYPRSDSYLSCKWHDAGSGYHWHLQCPYSDSYKTIELENLALVQERSLQRTVNS